MSASDVPLTGERRRVFDALFNQEPERWGRAKLHFQLGIAALNDECDRLRGAIVRKEGLVDMAEACRGESGWCMSLEDLADLHGLPSHTEESAKALAEILLQEIREDHAALCNIGGTVDCFWGAPYLV
jgi:hypothetical protein